jgi:replication factor C subunit 1
LQGYRDTTHTHVVFTNALFLSIVETTTATLVAKEAGRDLLEFNASDARSKKALQNNLGDITGSQAINFQKESDTNKNKQTKARLRCIVMDEVDGMGAGDRSGMAELIQMIKKSKVPIICICNDRQSLKMKSLLAYCLDLRFRRPTKNVMAARAVRIAQLEGMTVERNAAEAIAESCGNDVRQVLNCMQMWSNKDAGHASLTYKGLKEREHSINKDEILRVGLFDAAKTIMEGPRNLAGADNKAKVDSLFKRANAFFVDYSLVGLLVQHNYPKVMVKPFTDAKIEGDPDKQLEFLERMHSAALSMSDYAMVEHNIRGGDMNWSLLPSSGMLCVKTGYHAAGETGGFFPAFPEFTAWMGKNSSKGKKIRLLQELHHHMNYKISGGITELRQTYLPILREQFMRLLKSNEDGASTKAIELMDEYGLSREDVMEKLDEFVIGKEFAFADLDSKQKAALTREYNQGSHKSQALVSEQGGGGGTKKKGGKRERDPADLDAIDEDVVEESDVEDEEEDMKKLQEKFKKKGRKKAAPKGGAAKKSKSKKK